MNLKPNLISIPPANKLNPVSGELNILIAYSTEE